MKTAITLLLVAMIPTRRMDDGYSRLGVRGESELSEGWTGFRGFRFDF
jgi:hypothetical protein